MKLKPCPFCGGDRIRLLPQIGGFTVDCLDCGAMVREFTEYQSQVIAKWNQRAVERPT